jgi:hypothetical protein
MAVHLHMIIDHIALLVGRTRSRSSWVSTLRTMCRPGTYVRKCSGSGAMPASHDCSKSLCRASCLVWIFEQRVIHPHAHWRRHGHARRPWLLMRLLQYRLYKVCRSALAHYFHKLKQKTGRLRMCRYLEKTGARRSGI